MAKVYIDREKAIQTAVSHYKGVTQFDALEMVEAMESIPVADVVKVKHGEWIIIGKTKGRSNILQCSSCGKVRKGVGKSAYCRDCGAKMDGERK